MARVAACVLGFIITKLFIVGIIILIVWLAGRNATDHDTLMQEHLGHVQDMWKQARDSSQLTHEKRGVAPGEMLFGPVATNRTHSSMLSEQLALLQSAVISLRYPAPECATECLCTDGGVKAYGRYCGFKYSGCDGYMPCDLVDACCMAHDQCVGRDGYRDCGCTTALAKCLACAFYSSGRGRGAVSECMHMHRVAGKILADVLYVLPTCFDEAEKQALASAVDLKCKKNNI